VPATLPIRWFGIRGYAAWRPTGRTLAFAICRGAITPRFNTHVRFCSLRTGKTFFLFTIRKRYACVAGVLKLPFPCRQVFYLLCAACRAAVCGLAAADTAASAQRRRVCVVRDGDGSLRQADGGRRRRYAYHLDGSCSGSRVVCSRNSDNVLLRRRLQWRLLVLHLVLFLGSVLLSGFCSPDAYRLSFHFLLTSPLRHRTRFLVLGSAILFSCLDSISPLLPFFLSAVLPSG